MTSQQQYPPDWDSRRRQVYQRDDHICQGCGATGGPKGDSELPAHHIVSLSRGGSNEYSNLITLCDTCHSQVHGRPIGSQVFNSKSPDGATGIRTKYGGVIAHIIIFVFTVGLGNIPYGLWR
jgi:5-methylcytosine-specific restriction endonuclease McrA